MFHDTEFVRSIDLSKASLPGLVYLLRNRDLWPKGFVWNYDNPCNCAVGLSAARWGGNILSVEGRWYGAPRWYSMAAFDRRIDIHQVTPEMVADDIEKTF